MRPGPGRPGPLRGSRGFLIWRGASPCVRSRSVLLGAACAMRRHRKLRPQRAPALDVLAEGHTGGKHFERVSCHMRHHPYVQGALPDAGPTRPSAVSLLLGDAPFPIHILRSNNAGPKRAAQDTSTLLVGEGPRGLLSRAFSWPPGTTRRSAFPSSAARHEEGSDAFLLQASCCGVCEGGAPRRARVRRRSVRNPGAILSCFSRSAGRRMFLRCRRARAAGRRGSGRWASPCARL